MSNLSSESSIWKAKLPQLSLILITIIWVTTFGVVKYGLPFASPVLFVALRF
ncbi:EamA/RhaT family transporter, partial [Acinetobacter variabilis]